MQDDFDRDVLASERTIQAAERTFSAWIRTGLASLGGGLAIGRTLANDNVENRVVSLVIGGLLVGLGAGIFIYALISYRRSFLKLAHKGLTKNSLGAMIVMTALLLIIAALVLWLTLN